MRQPERAGREAQRAGRAAEPGGAGPGAAATGHETKRAELPRREAEPSTAATVFGDRLRQARQYVDLLVTTGISHGLVGPREAERIWTRHVLNCVAIAELVPAGSQVADVGSGAGLPGLPLAIARPDLTVVLLEPLLRRTTWLTDVVEAIGLENVEVVRARAEETTLGADVVTARAVAPLARLGEWSAGLVRPGGALIALKGETAPAELERDAEDLRRVGFTDGEVLSCAIGTSPPTMVVRLRRTDQRSTRTRRSRRSRGRR